MSFSVKFSTHNCQLHDNVLFYQFITKDQKIPVYDPEMDLKLQLEEEQRYLSESMDFLTGKPLGIQIGSVVLKPIYTGSGVLYLTYDVGCRLNPKEESPERLLKTCKVCIKKTNADCNRSCRKSHIQFWKLHGELKPVNEISKEDWQVLREHNIKILGSCFPNRFKSFQSLNDNSLEDLSN